VSTHKIVCRCSQIPLCGFPEGLPPNPHTLRGWSPDCTVHADEDTPLARLWAALPVGPCRCGLAKELEHADPLAPLVPPCPICGFGDWPEGGMRAARSIHLRAHEVHRG